MKIYFNNETTNFQLLSYNYYNVDLSIDDIDDQNGIGETDTS